MKRMLFSKNVYITDQTRLYSTGCADKILYYLWTGASVQISVFLPEANTLKKLQTIALGRADQNYFIARNLIFYSSFTNRSTKFADLQVIDLQGDQSFNLQNAHTDIITGIVQPDAKSLITSSLDGQIKFWEMIPHDEYGKGSFRYNEA